VTRTKTFLQSGGVLLLYLGLSLLLFAPAWAAPTQRNIGYSTDPQQFMWFLSWTAFALGHHHSPLVSTYLDYPHGVNLMWNAALLWPGAFLAPITSRLGPVFAYNLLETVALPLSGWCAYLAIGRWTCRLSATVGGLLYGFSPYMAAQALVHPPVVLAMTPPLVLLLLDELLVRRRWPAALTGAALGVVAAAQLLTWEELLATTALMAGLAVVLLLALQRPRPSIGPLVAPAARGAVGTAIVFLLIAAAPLYTQFRGPQRISGALHHGAPYVADLLSFVVPPSAQLLTPPWAARLNERLIAYPPEQNAYLGVPLLLLLVYITARWRSVLIVRWAAVLTVAGAVLAMGPHLEVSGHITSIPLPWLLVARLPLMRYVNPCRLTVFSYLGAGLLLAFFLDRLRGRPPWRGLGGVAVVVVAFAPLIPLVPYPSTPKVVPAFFSAAVHRIPVGAVALVAPYAGFTHGLTYSDAMLWQAAAGMRFRMPEGYAFVPYPSGNAEMRPPGSATQTAMFAVQVGGRAPALTVLLRRRIVQELRGWTIQTVIVGPMSHQGEMLRLFRYVLQRAPERVGGVYVWWRVGGGFSSARPSQQGPFSQRAY